MAAAKVATHYSWIRMGYSALFSYFGGGGRRGWPYCDVPVEPLAQEKTTHLQYACSSTKW